jgi:hypothetical protein
MAVDPAAISRIVCPPSFTTSKKQWTGQLQVPTQECIVAPFSQQLKESVLHRPGSVVAAQASTAIASSAGQ